MLASQSRPLRAHSELTSCSVLYDYWRDERNEQIYCSIPCPAPPLILDNVLEVVKRVRSWRELGVWLMGWYSAIDGNRKLDDFQNNHASDEACLRAVVEAFLLGEGRYQPSWRRVIHALHWIGESNLAETINTNAEPVQGECIWMM